jgi:hypothetical protein
MAIVAVAYAVNNTVSYSGKVTYKGKPTKTKPVNMGYEGILHVGTDQAGQQPETAPTTTIYYAKGIKTNAKYFPFCNQSEIDGQPTFPAKCKKAIVGTGTAQALAGSSGGTGSLPQYLTVTAVNGPKGKVIYLVLRNKPGSVDVPNRVIPGTFVKSSGAFAFVNRFQIPPNLQNVAGLDIALTDFDVKLPATPRKVKVGKVFKKIGYLQLTTCKGNLPAKAIVDFKDKDTGQTKPVTATSSSKCH